MYRFYVKDQTGTYWYHAHLGAQRGQGLYGAFIIHERQWSREDEVPEHVMVLSDWNHDYDSTTSECTTSRDCLYPYMSHDAVRGKHWRLGFSTGDMTVKMLKILW